MAKTVVGSFESPAEAQRVAAMLEDGGIERRQIQVLDSAAAREYEQTWTGEKQGGGFWSWLFGDVESDRGKGFPEDESAYYREELGRGAAFVVVTTRDEDADRVRALMQRGGAEVDVRAADTRAGRATTASEAAAASEKEQVLPVVEEQMKVGKRTVERGGIRVYTHVTERPVEEHIRLREERIRVERRRVDRPLTAAPGRAFEEQTIELTETAEEPVIAKQARVVEEVVVSKDVQERDETIREKVRRADVEVERTGSGARAGFAAMEPDFRQHCTRTFGGRGLTYEQCSPAYRYGYELAGDRRYTGEWSAVEADVRRQWEEREPGTWERFKDAIRYAWDSARGKARAA